VSRTRPTPDEGIVTLVDELLAKAIARRASDIHFEPEEAHLRVRFRLDGLLQDVDRLPANLAENVIARLKVLAGLLTYRADIPQEGAFVANGRWAGQTAPDDIRIATFPTVRGERAVIRLFYGAAGAGALDELGLAAEMVQELRKAAAMPHGLILVTGPAGSGKSTTLYAMAKHILAITPGRSVVSLEDPVEQRVTGMAQIQISPYGELDYARAMRSLLRQDVQVLLVGEVRDAETAHLVIEAALTGHLIMSTMHSGDPAEAIVRLLEMGVAPYQVVGALSVVCSQRLLRTLCEQCRNENKARNTCEVCAGTGYRGRTACGQIALLDQELRQAILAHAPSSQLRSIINRRPDLSADAQRLIAAGKTTLEEMQQVLGI